MTAQLKQSLDTILGSNANLLESCGQLILEIHPQNWTSVCQQLRDEPSLRFDMCMDLCGVDYKLWGHPSTNYTEKQKQFPGRFAVVAQLMSTVHNWRLRVRTFATDNEFPVVPTLLNVWPSVNWFEREAYDLFGIVFQGHPDLRRILTDYGFIGHPFRKDFPLSGHVEMIYDETLRRVIYQPVTIEPREITPRIIREEGYGAN
ncbi:NADH-quinone oxidoreductase subunit C [Brackiella oedipodis]|uniref:NADH-quinone oxidoreductase subunit C n=1 Tax=Brackiella oedipodis TaxID=124225 RepID=UPI00048C1AB7|nr:NADH-quinone oxidoreductase subunit C [Brackiella oedipodis]